MQRFVTEMCTFLLQNGALWDMGLVHCGICEMGHEFDVKVTYEMVELASRPLHIW